MSVKSRQLYTLYDQADQWVEQNLKYEEKKTLSNKIKKTRSDVKKIINSIESKPVFALFGVSQVGKSYLVKNLLSVSGAPLNIFNSNGNCDFLREINPEGAGAESTGVVTRFSIDHVIDHEDFPIRAKLLSVKDIVIVLCDSFFSDLTRMDNYPTRLDFKNHCIELESLYHNKLNCQTFFTEDDIWDINGYFNHNFNKFSYYVEEIEHGDFWQSIGYIISKIPPKGWVAAFSILWGKNPSISIVFERLIEEAQKIGFESLLYLPFSSVLRTQGRILDVQLLNNILFEQENIQVQLNDGSKADVGISLLSALIAEITLPVPKEVAEAKPFLNNTDLLDFPGARGRLQLGLEDINNESVVHMLIRGKISYLFNKYSSDYEINNLLFCLKDEQIEVNEIPAILYDWIQKNIGPDATSREKRIGALPSSPLFVVFTFFNRQIDFDSTNDQGNLDYKWKNRFNKFFEQQIITTVFDWSNNWTDSDQNFKNFYLLRDFKYSGDTFDGYSDTTEETTIRAGREVHWNRLKESFLQFPFVKTHFQNPTKAWEAAALPSNDGSSLILENLTMTANNFVKIKNYSERLVEYRDFLKRNLEKHHRTEDIKSKRDKAFQEGNEIIAGLLPLLNDSQINFGLFLKKNSLEETEVYNYIHDNFLMMPGETVVDSFELLQMFDPELHNSMSRSEILERLKTSLRKETHQDVEEFLQENGINLDSLLESRSKTSATALVNGIIEMWEEKLNSYSSGILISRDNMRSAILKFNQNLITVFHSLDIKSELTKIFEQRTRLLVVGRDAEEYLASIATAYINDFVSSFGANFMQPERLKELNDIAQEYGIDTTMLSKPAHLIPEKNDLISIYDGQALGAIQQRPILANSMRYFLSIRLALLSNCGFTNYNVNANFALSEIMSQLGSLDFSISKPSNNI